MTEDRTDDDGKCKPANDNCPSDGPESDAAERLDAVVLSIARIIGRRMAREDFAALTTANDNAPKSGDEGGT